MSGRQSRPGKGVAGGYPTETISEAWIIMMPDITPTAGSKWSFPPAPTYKIPYWVVHLGVELPPWMFEGGHLTIDLNWDDRGLGYDVELYEASWDSTQPSRPYQGGGGGFSGFGRGGGGGGGGGGICYNFKNSGECRFGDSCSFSHDVGGRTFVLPERPAPDAGRGRGRGRGESPGGRGGGGRGDRGGRGGARGGRGGGGGGGGICRFYNTSQGCKFGAGCNMRHE